MYCVLPKVSVIYIQGISLYLFTRREFNMDDNDGKVDYDIEKYRNEIIEIVNNIERADILIYLISFIKTKFKVG